ncbi:hypothetical protein LCGC14_0922210 [marine sediment metagenome]|uniref:Uncharacterized protein n=1 Tax=marine sediment metagenome TaxID=412755 RepID=A0A0F9NQE7_9ZZZZ
MVGQIGFWDVQDRLLQLSRVVSALVVENRTSEGVTEVATGMAG